MFVIVNLHKFVRSMANKYFKKNCMMNSIHNKVIWLLVCIMMCTEIASAQKRSSAMQITGTVKDELNVVMVGVSVSNITTSDMTKTDESGRYNIFASRGDSLEFSYVGYDPIKVAVTNSIEIPIIMKGGGNSLNEIVVVGYGQQRRINVLGAQSTIKVEDLKQPVANLSASLAGRIAGLVGIQRSGLPGMNQADVWIRGISTFTGTNSSSPLIIVDGIQGRDLNAFDPEDISSFSILKDAAATAVYGAQGANGVILITTKKGLAGKPSLMFNYNEGINSFTKLPKLATGAQYMELRNEALKASGMPADYSDEYIKNTLSGVDPILYPDVDWMSTIFKNTSLNRRFNFSARGGSENTQYYSSLAYYDESSMFRTDNLQKYKADTKYRKYNFTSNVDMNWTKTTKFSLGIQGYVSNTNYPGMNPQSAYARVMQTNPVLYPVMYPGNLVPGLNSSRDYQPNPYGLLTQTGYQNLFESQIYSNAGIYQDLGGWIKGLNAKIIFSFDTWNTHNINRRRDRTWYAIDRNNPYNEDGSPNLNVVANGSDALGYERSNNGNRQFYTEANINYSRVFGDHSVSGMVLFNQTDYTASFASDLTSSLPYRNRGISGRATYSWKERYFGEFNFGYNGSENFAPDKRYGFFPSFGVGWVLSNEPFFASVKEALQFVKFRYSNGLVGSGSGGRRFGYLTLVSDGGKGYTFGDPSNKYGYSGVVISDYGADIVWSQSHKQNLGLELKTFKELLSLTVDVFKEHRKGVFLQRNSLPGFLGFQNSPYGNLGIIDNKGIDGTLDLAPVKLGGDASISLRGTFSYNKDKVIENDDPVQPFSYMEHRGTNLNATFGYVAEGLYQSEAELTEHADQSALGNQRVGDIKYKDLNNDGVINANDRTRIGNGNVPKWVFGFGINLTYKKFFISGFLQGATGADRLMSGDGILPFNNSNGGERSNLFAVAEDRWTAENPKEKPFYPRLAFGNSANNNNSVVSSWWVKDMNYLRLKTVDLGYYFPDNWIKGIYAKNARIYIQGVNLLYWSPFKLWDPEIDSGNGTVYPMTRNISIGLQINF
ncbi:TonB-linked outer membrane protein, SusC/RagA family [bacterium A37T11]|nr:TonB-linked outer membrane protein, SusC/RagA family [bacterium A37T11]